MNHGSMDCSSRHQARNVGAVLEVKLELSVTGTLAKLRPHAYARANLLALVRPRPDF